MNIADINILARNLVDATTTSLTAANLLIYVNMAYEEVAGDLITLDRNWKWDDTNRTDLPIGTATLVAGQQDYSFDSSILSVERVEVLDINGIWHKLNYFDEGNMVGSVGEASGVIGTVANDIALAEYQKTDGLPREYAVRANSMFLYPAPAAANCTLASGLKTYFQRTADKFTSAQVTTGTKEPGFASPYHPLIAYRAALIYALSYKKDRVAFISNEIARLEKKMFLQASTRMRDKQAILMPMAENNE